MQVSFQPPSRLKRGRGADTTSKAYSLNCASRMLAYQHGIIRGGYVVVCNVFVN